MFFTHEIHWTFSRKVFKPGNLCFFMQKTGIVNLPLHGGSAPRWLFSRMVKLSGAISEIVIDEYGQEEFIRRLSDPYWFQALSCVIGFDWHSSGTTTTTCGALKESINKLDVGIKICGGKGKASRKTQSEIENSNLSTKKIEKLKYSSKMSAKVDSAVLQDSYELYHHCFIFTEKGNWAVVQQGMNSSNRYARRYHWLSGNVGSFVEEPHNAICCDEKNKNTLDMTAKESKETRKISLDIVRDNPNHLKEYIKEPIQKTINDFDNKKIINFTMNQRHIIIDMNKRNIQSLRKAYEIQPRDYEELVAIKGIGPKTIRSLALISELVYGTKASWRDPVKYSFAHGGKDGYPYRINKKHYDKSIEILKSAVDNANIGNKDKLYAIKRLSSFYH
jgi:hypothetical protein